MARIAVKEDRYGLLLALMVLALVLSPINLQGVRPVITLLLGLVLLFAQRTSGAGPRMIAISSGAVIVGVIAGAAAQLSHARPATMTWAIVNVLFCIGTIATIITRLLEHIRVNIETVLGALTVYLLLALTFAYFYVIIATARNGSFFAQGGHHDAASYLYFSLITITTTGYGDLTAGTSGGRMLAALEALIGQLYLVTVVAVLVANIGRERMHKS